MNTGLTVVFFVMSCFRYAVKLSIDELIFGVTESFDELCDTIEDYEKNWLIDIEGGPAWKNAIKWNKPSLFTISKQEV